MNNIYRAEIAAVASPDCALSTVPERIRLQACRPAVPPGDIVAHLIGALDRQTREGRLTLTGAYKDDIEDALCKEDVDYDDPNNVLRAAIFADQQHAEDGMSPANIAEHYAGEVVNELRQCDLYDPPFVIDSEESAEVAERALARISTAIGLCLQHRITGACPLINSDSL